MQNGRNIQFNRGKVSYNGQTDIFCDYAVVTEADGNVTNYYFLNDRKLDNGLFIASTVLKEAIDASVPASSLGVIDKDGNVIIPFENKEIKSVEDKYLLVVRSMPRSQSVIDAVSSSKDPSAAERMVNANASIKEKLNKQMNNQGVFLFHNLLGEATMYEMDSKGIRNLFGGEYYSFIGMTQDDFYCSTNVAESSVIEVPRNAPIGFTNNEPVNEVIPTIPTSQVVPEEETPKEEVAPIDVSKVEVPKAVIDQALESASDLSDEQSNLDTVEVNSVPALENNVLDTAPVENEVSNVEVPPVENVVSNMEATPSENEVSETLSEVHPDSIIPPVASDVVDTPTDVVSVDEAIKPEENMVEEDTVAPVSEGENSEDMDLDLNDDVSEVLETIEQNNRIYQDVINENKKLHQSYEELRTQVEMLTKQNKNLRRQNMQYKEGFNHIKSVLVTPNTVENVSVNEKVM